MTKALFVSLLAAAAAFADDLPRQAAEVIAKNCLACHGAAMRMSDLDLRTRESMLKGGKRGPAISPGAPDQSRLISLIQHAEQPAMPPGKQLPEYEVTILTRWIGTGAPLDKPIGDDATDAKKAMAAMEERPITAEEKKFWAFQPVKRTVPPTASKPSWVKNPIDAFLLQAMDAKKLIPSPEASKRALVRRAYLDLWGLPPSPAAV